MVEKREKTRTDLREAYLRGERGKIARIGRDAYSTGI
jgi:hypothetical protein